MFRIVHGSGSRPGRVRTVNEDSVLAQPPVFVVADGMGGHQGGRLASAIVVEEFDALRRDHHLDTTAVLHALRIADERVRGLVVPGSADGGPGTTVAGIVGVDVGGHDYWLVLNVGDSRVYRLEEDDLHQVSVDHSVVQEMVTAGDLDPAAARNHRDRHVITRAVGAADAAEPDCWLLPVTVGTRLLVCSDGLSGVLDDDALAGVLRSRTDPQAAVDELLARVGELGGGDDVSAVVIDVLATAGTGPGSDDPSSASRPDDEATRPRAAVVIP